MIHRIACILVTALLLSACKDDPSAPTAFSIPAGRGIYVLNEGLFQQGNSTLSYYDIANGQVYQDVFARINGRNLGDVGNAIVVRSTLGYVVVNNSHKIEIIDLATCVSQGTITFAAGTGPRQMAFVNDSIALVTGYNNGEVLVLNVRSRNVQQTIAVGSGPEGITIAGGKAFVAISGFGSGRGVAVIDIASLAVLQTVEVGDNPYEVQWISDDVVYILCVGFYNDFNDPNDDTPAKVYAMNTSTLGILDSVLIGDHAFKLAVGTGRCYVPVLDSVKAIDTQTHAYAETVVSGTFFYGIGADPVSGDILLGDPRTYTVPGAVRIYSSTGTLRSQFDVGLIPGSFAFKP